METTRICVTSARVEGQTNRPSELRLLKAFSKRVTSISLPHCSPYFFDEKDDRHFEKSQSYVCCEILPHAGRLFGALDRTRETGFFRDVPERPRGVSRPSQTGDGDMIGDVRVESLVKAASESIPTAVSSRFELGILVPIDDTRNKQVFQQVRSCDPSCG